MAKFFISINIHASLKKITYRLMCKQWCGGKPSENVATRDEGPAAVKLIHSKKYFLSLIGTKRGFSCRTQRTSGVTWPTWLTRLWKNWTSWPTRPTRTPCNIWLRWEGVILLFTVYVSAQACAHPTPLPHPSHTLPLLYVHVLPSAHLLCTPESGCSPLSSCPLLISPGGWVGTGSTKGTISLQFSLTSAMGVLLHEKSYCGCGWEEVCITETACLESFTKPIKLSSWLNLGRCSCGPKSSSCGEWS